MKHSRGLAESAFLVGLWLLFFLRVLVQRGGWQGDYFGMEGILEGECGDGRSFWTESVWITGVWKKRKRLYMNLFVMPVMCL